ncbi:unnamed protein product [Agarophyton chilense]|eukprot:gb/GEZJ01000311.1/.p1 GENE.gb/GEZJ01000311.1/~~gb/GEZJ01000311.1/.p1  ORF type:complete len:755 (+),score=73.43 gb/GEZJ01000311.1/:223-2487(+)
MSLRLALIDNYDSYTYILAHLVATANCNNPPQVFRSDAYSTLSDLHSAHGMFDAFILSPGPGTPVKPRDFSPLQHEIVSGSIPTLAICLGHQGLCHHYGSEIVHAPHGPRHGVISRVTKSSNECPLLRGIPYSFDVVRYHSLCVKPKSLPQCLLPTLWTVDGDATVLMGVRHVNKPVFGLQFHPESVATNFGQQMANNFIKLATVYRTTQPIYRSLTPTPQVCSPTFRTLVRSVDLLVSPLALFKCLYGDVKQSFWLDSSTNATPSSRCSSPNPGEECTGLVDAHPARYSIMGACNGPFSELVTYDVSLHTTTVHQKSKKEILSISVFDYLKKALKNRQAEHNPELPIEMNGGYVGFFGYEMKSDVDEAIESVHTSHLPDAWFVFADRLLIIDHIHDKLYFVALARDGYLDDYRDGNTWFENMRSSVSTVLDGNGMFKGPSQGWDKVQSPLRFIPERSRSQYLSDIRKCLKYIHDGESYEVCLTNRLRATLPHGFKQDPLELYSALRLVNPSPFSAFLRLDNDHAVCCSSPERYLQISSSGQVESKPIKGTLPRGKTVEEDNNLRRQLQQSPKDRSENLMIVDLVRNDLSRMCEVGSVTVPKLMCVESYATVHQLVSTVRGKLAPSCDPIDCVRGAYPMGSMTGAPKLRTLEIIDRLEASARGIYSGSIGYLSVSGAVDLNVVIRTAVLNGPQVEIGVGGAIVAMSSPKEEYEETILKGMAIMKALTLNETGNSDVIVVHEPQECIKVDRIDES